MQEKRKRSKTSIIIAVAAAVLLIVVMVVWRQYEAKHKDELQASVLTTDISKAPIEEEPEPEPESATPKQVIPDDPEKLIAMAEDALKDEGYFEEIGRERGKGDHVHFLLNKCLDCDGDPGKVEGLARRLKERSKEGYGPWRVDSAVLAELDDRIKAAKQL